MAAATLEAPTTAEERTRPPRTGTTPTRRTENHHPVQAQDMDVRRHEEPPHVVEVRSEVPETPADVVKIPAKGFFRSVAAIIWSAVRHPRTTTDINLFNGEVLGHRPSH